MIFINRELETDKKWIKLKEKMKEMEFLNEEEKNTFSKIMDIMKEIENEEKPIIEEFDVRVDEENFHLYNIRIKEKNYQHLSKGNLTEKEAKAYYHKLCEEYEFRKVIWK